MSAMAVSVDMLPAREARLTAAQTGGVSGDALTFHAQLEKQGTACCSVERSGQNFVQVTIFTSFLVYCSTEEKTGQQKTTRTTAGRGGEGNADMGGAAAVFNGVGS